MPKLNQLKEKAFTKLIPIPRTLYSAACFKKVALAPGETAKVTFEIDKDMLKFYDPAQNGWVLEEGDFTAYIGAASDDIRTSVGFAI